YSFLYPIMRSGPYDATYNSTGTDFYLAGADDDTVAFNPGFSGVSTTLPPWSQPEGVITNGRSTTYAVADGTASGCAVNGSVLTAATTGTCDITATMSGDSVFNPVTSSQVAV